MSRVPWLDQYGLDEQERRQLARRAVPWIVVGIPIGWALASAAMKIAPLLFTPGSGLLAP